jgi:hypothetical protein
MLLSGCARYQMEVANNTLWRLDTRTGALEACGFEQGKPICHPFPAPK